MEPLSPVAHEDSLQRRLAALVASRGVGLQIGSDVLHAAGEILSQWLPPGLWALVCDSQTWRVAGKRLHQHLSGDVQVLRLSPRVGHAQVTAGNQEVSMLRSDLQQQRVSGAIAVGSGTINDLTRAACDELDLPYVVVPTAPSMNGYLSASVALLVEGVKTTHPCRAPRGCLVDGDVLAAAPATMRGAGYGDLRSRATSCADWALSHILTGTPFVPDALNLVGDADEMIEGIGPALARAEAPATIRLMGGLLLSGLAMDVAGTSAPSSGAEHLVSHYLDMEHYAWGASHDLHGRQVAVATITIAHLYERLLEVDRPRLEIDKLARQAPWSADSNHISQSFGPLWPAVQPTARLGDNLSNHQIVERLRRFATTEHLTLVKDQLIPASVLRRSLAEAGAPVTFGELGVDRARARRAIVQARHIRARYTILDLAAELGCLETWADEALELSA